MTADILLDLRRIVREELRALLIAEGHALLAEQGLARFSGREVAKRAGYSVGTIYNVFGSIGRLVAAINSRTFTQWAGFLRERLERFWLPDRGYYSMGFGGDGRASEALASNQGHLLWALALPQERARAVRDAVMSDAMFSGWGIRTLAAGEAGYNLARVAAVLAARAWGAMFADPELDVALHRTIHGDQRFTWLRPLRAGDVVVILEAMKMEHTLTAARDGMVAEVLAGAGDQVEAGAPLIRLEDDDA